MGELRRERKVVTVLFADLVSFTSRAEQLDPEDVEAILRPYHERLRYELERWGGTVEKFIGDAVVAFFGAPIAGEDDPERAVRAALSIRDWIAEEGKLEVRIAVNTGEALVNLAARPEAGEGMAVGDVVNTAARMESAAPVNGVLVGETTYRATADSIEYRDHPAVAAKGKEQPVRVWEAVEARARFGVDLVAETRSPLVGRERELDQLVGAFARAREQRSPELVTLVGVPGIGKSRLVGELFQSIDRGGRLTYWRQGRSLPYGAGVSYWALGEMIKAQAGVLETDADEEVEAKLRRAVEQLVSGDANWVLSHLLPLVGQAGDESSGSQEESFAAWRRFFEALAEQRPLVLVFEDIQWADDGLLDFIDHLADWVEGVPMLIVCTARRELLDRRPGWGGGKVNAATIALGRLSDDETAKLIAELSVRSLLEAQTQAALLDRAGGNPLYAEQYVRMLAERDDAEDLPLPESIQGIIAARLDALAPRDKALLQEAAVIGKVFWLGALAASEQQLHALRLKEFVQRARRSSVEGETEYAFKHVLVRDVAYGQIPRPERAEKHLRAAEWIQSLGRLEDHAEMLAHHYVNALELTRAAGRDDAALVGPTVGALRDSGDRALTLNALPQAAAYFEQALALVADDDPQRSQLLFRLGRVKYLRDEEGAEEFQAARDGSVAAGDRDTAAEAALMLADIAWKHGRRADVVRHLEHARTLVAGAPPSRAKVSVLASIVRYTMLADENEEAVELADEPLRLARQLGLDALQANVLNSLGSARAALGDRSGMAEIERSIELAAKANSIDDLLRGHNNLVPNAILYGDLEDAQRRADETLRLARHYGHDGFARFMEGGAMVSIPYHRGEWDRALEHADPFLADVERGLPHYQSGTAYCLRGLIRVGRGDAAGAASDAERGLEVARRIEDPQALHSVLAMAAMIFVLSGNDRRAEKTVAEALAAYSGLRQMGFAVVALHHLAWAALRVGREDEVRAVVQREPFRSGWADVVEAVADSEFRAAADALREMGSQAGEAFYRLCAAERLVAAGRRAEADKELRRALAFYRGVDAKRHLREGEALLAASA
jgi:class 3 adenylate cyclase